MLIIFIIPVILFHLSLLISIKQIISNIPIMKKAIYLILCLLIGLVGCKSEKDAKNDKKLSDSITGVFSYSKGGNPVFKIKDTIIKGKKSYTIYDYRNKTTIEGDIFYQKNDSLENTKKISNNFNRIYNDWDKWLFNAIFTETKKEVLFFNKVKKNIIFYDNFKHTLKINMSMNEKNYDMKFLGFNQKITTGFSVWITEGLSKREVKILHKISDL